MFNRASLRCLVSLPLEYRDALPVGLSEGAASLVDLGDVMRLLLLDVLQETLLLVDQVHHRVIVELVAVSEEGTREILFDFERASLTINS